jgi:ABC-2 type transport system permease protein
MFFNMPPQWRGFFALTQRETERFWTIKAMTVFPPIITTLLYIVVFGFSLGGHIESLHGFSYIQFILPGLVMMTVMMNSFMNCSSILFMARYDYTIQDVLLSPLSNTQMVLAYTLSGIARGMLVGSLVLLSGIVVLKMPVQSFGLTLLFMFLTCQVFSSFGIIVGLFSESWDNIMIFMNFLITPLIFLGGVFYSVDMLPAKWQLLNALNPVFYMVSGIRAGILGFQECTPLTALLLTLSVGTLLFSVSVYLFKIGFKLKV